MLGLGKNVLWNGIVSDPVARVTYSSDFSSGVDGFSAHFDQSPSIATLTGGATKEGKDNSLEISWSGTEDGIFHVRKLFPDLADQSLLGPVVNFYCEVYYDFAADGPVDTIVRVGDPTSSEIFQESLSVGQWHSIHATEAFGLDVNLDGYLYIGFLDPADAPVDGDKMYVRNVWFSFEDKD
jgi:hypothetical protein